MSALGQRTGSDIRTSSNALPWMVEYALVLANRYLVGYDGTTAHETSRVQVPRCWDSSSENLHCSGEYPQQIDW